MRQLLPEATDIDPAAAHASAHRPPRAGRPWVLLNMVASADGATAVDGVSSGLGGPADKRVFSAIRAVADVIVVAAGTARAESYGPPSTSETRRRERAARGQSPFPRLALITRSLDLDPASAMFTEAHERPLIYTVDDAPSDRHRALEAVAEIVSVGQTDVDLVRLLADLAGRGVGVVLLEGGPGLNGQFVAADLVDELDVSVAPKLVGGDSSRLAHGPAGDAPTDLTLAHLWDADGMLFARYVRADP